MEALAPFAQSASKFAYDMRLLCHLRELEELDRSALRPPPAASPHRTLPDEHFEFCLGMSDPGLPGLRTRLEDPALQRRSRAAQG